MNKIVGVLAVTTAVLVVIIMATLLPPILWLLVSVLAIAVGVWRVGWFIRWLERHDSRD